MTAVLLLLLAAAPVRRANIFEFVFPNGARAELEFLSTSSFRLSQVESFDRSRVPITSEAVRVECTEYGCKTEHIRVDLAAAGVRVARANGQELLNAQLKDGRFEARTRPGERYYGLGAHRSARLELRGFETATGGLLISSAGYGEYRPEKCSYTLSEIRRVVSCEGDYYFYFGPNPKEILEEHALVVPSESHVAWIVRSDRTPRTWKDLRETLYALQHASLSGLSGPPFKSGGYQGAARASAERIAALLPVVHAPTAATPALRERLTPYLTTYAWEARDRGIPIVRPLAMQFPEDTAAAARTDEFMIGDEVLVAPALDESGSVKVYLPRGNWTDLRTNILYKGRQEIAVTAGASLPMFVRNGMLLPVATPRGLEMHYFPSLAAEFFLYEPEQEYISQFHAAPATNLLRLESESLIGRSFEWVVHHADPPSRVYQGERTLTDWRYDAKSRLLYIRVKAAAGGDEIVHVAF